MQCVFNAETHKEYTVMFVLGCKSFVVTSLSIVKVFFGILTTDLGGGTSQFLKGRIPPGE